MLKRRLMAVLVALVMMFAGTATVFAKDEGSKITRDKALEIGTQILPELKNSKNYNINLMDYWEPNSGKVWSINLNLQDSIPAGNASIMIDADNGSIRRFDKWLDYRILGEYFIPKFTKEELRKKGEDLIKKFQPEEFKQVEYKEEPGYQVYNGDGLRQPVLQNFWYVRKVGNIPYSKDGFRVTLNSTTGEVTSYEFMWSKTNLPTPENTMPIEKAKQEFIKNVPIKLIYTRPWIDGNSDDNRQLKLAYSMPGTYFAGDVNAIDAKTGKPLNYGGKEAQILYERVGSQSQNQIIKADKLPKPLNQDEAKTIAQKELEKYYKVNDLKLTRSDYLEDYYGMKQKAYVFAWSNNDVKVQNNFTFTVTVDAETGAVVEINYDKNDPSQYRENQTPPSITWENGKDKAKAFVVEKFSQFKDQLIFVGSQPYYPEEKMGGYYPPIYYYSFIRVVNGAMYPDNGVYVSINNKTGEIVNYRYRWEYVDFPEIKNTISQKQAEDTFIKQIGIQLNYRIRYDMPIPNAEGLLVYETRPTNAAYIDAYTGKIKTYDGKDYDASAPRANVSQIVNGQREAILLNDIGVINVDESYKPENAITKGQFIKALAMLKSYAPYSYASSVKSLTQVNYDQYINTAVKLGWLDSAEGFKPESNITRQEMAVILSKFMGYDEIIKAKIIKVSFTDANEFEGNNGEAAQIIKSLNLIKTTGDKFEPNKAVSNEEAVRAIYYSIEKSR